MFEELQLALFGCVSPERLLVILDAQRLLNEIGLTSADEELQTIIGLQDGISDTDLLIGRIDDCLLIALGGTLREYGVVCQDDVTMAILTAVLRTVSQFEYYLIPENLSDVLNSTRDNEAIVAALIPLFTEVSEAEAMDSILTVDDSTIRRMQTVVGELLAVLPGEIITVDSRDLRVHRINQLLLQTHQMHPVVVLGLAQGGVRMGMPLDFLCELALEQIEALDLEPLAYELVGLAYFSNTKIQEILNTLMELAMDLTDDPAQQIRLKEFIEKAYHELADLAEVKS